MLRPLMFGLGLLSATMLSHGAFAEGGHTLQIVVSKDKQSMVVYDGETVVTTTKVSTGKAGHTTPSGIFSILQKEKYHESNLYSNAPMPWMQRLTWSGIALHEGVVPNYPASHGCIRMPGAFAKSLYQMTERGAHVIITEAPVAPQRIDNANLFQPRKPLPNGPLFPDVELRTSSIKGPVKPVEVAMNVVPGNPAAAHPIVTPPAAANEATPAEANIDAAPLRILITRRGDRETLMDAQTILQELGFETGGSDGFAGPMTRSAIAGFKRWKNLSPKGSLLTPEFLTALYETAGKPRPPAGQILVRQSFEPLFEAPIGIRDPQIALGTHFFTVDKVDRKAETGEWHSLTLPNKLSDATMTRLGITIADDAGAPGAAGRTLDRIEIPADIRDRIETMLTDGSSLTINDQGLGPETGDGTDFITITQPEGRVAQAMADAEPTITKPRPVRQTRSELKSGMIGLY
ncbi:L,D-transpeptidase family protein [Rhizobium terrae]|uniref:L,D-transpeptidase family protein n=1 Tax=Rhizobium terrae TaxID=2171756 RepID=UPI000E3ECB59|nr:L,D-transpeptidase family protein [Rhizobium terrae]